MISPMLTFAVFAIRAHIAGNASLSISQAFTSFAIIRLITQPAEQLLVTLPQAISALACLARIRNYLISAERTDCRLGVGQIEPSLSQEDRHMDDDIQLTFVRESKLYELPKATAIVFSDASIRPSLPPAPVLLHNLNIHIPHSNLTMILGPVGCGKSTLIRAMLGELVCDSGFCAVSTREIAYCAQSPWLPNTSIQETVCGMDEGTFVDEKWYETVIKACALDHDIARLPDGNQSVLGNKGLTLSGGQKQRLVSKSVLMLLPVTK